MGLPLLEYSYSIYQESLNLRDELSKYSKDSSKIIKFKGKRMKQKELGFKELSTDNYLEIMQDEDFEYADEYTSNNWFIYEGDLEVSTEDFASLAENSSFLIKGNLIVDGVLNIEDKTIFILGDVIAKSIIIECSTCYISGVASFDEALILAIGDGQPIEINDTKGSFVFSRLDSAEINVSKEKVKVFVDYSYDNSFGEFEDLLDDRFIDDEDINLDALCNAILGNEMIFKKAV